MWSRRRFLAVGAASGAALAIGAGCKPRAGVTIGSKNFQEQWILAALIEQLVERETSVSAGTKDLAGTMLSHKALESGAIDCYVEYTGTALTAVLDLPPSHDVAAVYQQVQREYQRRFDLEWLPALGFENTFAMLVRRADAERHQLHTISDLARVADRFRPGFGFEFYDRPDGYRGLLEAYGLAFSREPKQMKLGVTYRALDAGEVDLIAGNSTDGLIAKLDLVMLTDDKRYFPPYYAAPVLRGATARSHPAVRAAIARLGGAIPAAAMRDANYAVDAEGTAPREAAAALLASLELH
ncbi:MAG TPA: glycine betaine ABC transporter substrate-binding protein [Kofleriaceae bacterium]|nr:glycine betaine ABC transporter substrate-binding protein [Kofleriaceae bacterium]